MLPKLSSRAHRVTHRQVLAFLWRSVRRHLLPLGAVVLFVVGSTALGLVQPFFYKEAVDAIATAASPDEETFRFVLAMVLLGVLFCALCIVLSDAAFCFLAWVETRIMREAWGEVFAHVQRLSTHFHVDSFAGATTRKIGRGVDALESMMDVLCINFLPLAIHVIGFAVVLSFFAPPMAFLILLCVAVYVPVSIV